MNIKKILSILGIIGTMCTFNSTKASTEVLIFNENGFPLIMENGVAVRPENAVANARIFLAQELRRLWAGVEPFPEELIRTIARSADGDRPRLIVAGDIGIRNYPGINQRVYDRQRRIAVPGYRPAVPAKSAAYYAEKARIATRRNPPRVPERRSGYYAKKAHRAEERAARLAERNATAARAPTPTRERSFLNRLFGGNKDYEVDEGALADDVEEREYRRAELDMARDRANRAADDYDRFGVESARGDARKAMKDYDLFGPDRSEEYSTAKQMWIKNHSQSKGWYKRMLNALKKEFPREVAAERKYKK